MSLSDDTFCSLLSGEVPPGLADSVRLAISSSTKFLDDIVASLSMNSDTSIKVVRILQQSPFQQQSSDLSQSLQSYAEFLIPNFDGIRRGEPHWVQCPEDSADPRILKFSKRIRIHRGNSCHHFLLTKVQFVNKDEQELRLHCCSQSSGVVHLFAESKIGVDSGVFRIRNLHPEFDGCRLGSRSSDLGSFDFVMKKQIFPKQKKTFRDGEFAFIGQINETTAVYEISRIQGDPNPPPTVVDMSVSSDMSSDSEVDPNEVSLEEYCPVIQTPVPPAAAAKPVGDQVLRPGDREKLEYISEQIKVDLDCASRTLMALVRLFDKEAVAEAFLESGVGVNVDGEELRMYQKEAVEIVVNPGNFLLCSATGTGKTRVFIEVAKRTLEMRPSLKVVVIVPKLALTSQHAKSFENNLPSWGNFTVDTFSNDNSGQWDARWKRCDVAVATADYFANRLEYAEATFDSISLLILDEAHHTRGDSPYRRIMMQYSHHLADTDDVPTKVFGVTATPIHGPNSEQMDTNFNSLLKDLHVPESHVVMIDDDNKHFTEIIPQARPETILVDTRSMDSDFINVTAIFLRNLLTETLPEFFNSHQLSFLSSKTPPCTYSLVEGSDNKSRFQQWKGELEQKMTNAGTTGFVRKDIEHALCTICLIQESVDNCKDVGVESASSKLKEQLKQEERDLISVQTMLGGGGGHQSPEGSLFFRLQGLIAENPCFQSLNQSTSVAGVISPVECGNFPKFVALLRVLEEYKDRQDVHGMVFVRTRLGADWICNALKKSLLQDKFHFLKIVGQGRRTDTQRNESTGMNLNQQNAILESFRETGRKILVSTSVCDEGVDVISCELIIRYNAALSGTELKQSMGRARKRDAKFVNIVERGTKEHSQLKKATTEERESKRTIMMRQKIVHIS
eukprot:g4731.t1